MNRPAPRLPNRPAVDPTDVEQLRSTVPTAEGELPKGAVYQPSDEDFRPLAKAVQHDIPDFIPQELAMEPSEFLSRTRSGERVMLNSDPLPPVPEGYPMDEEDDPEAEAMMAELRNQQGLGSRGESTDSRRGSSTLPKTPKKHPMLAKLLSSFGIERVPVRETDIGGMKFVFRMVSAPNKLVAVRYASLRSRTPDEMKINVGYITSMLGIVSIDGVNIYEMMGADLNDMEKTMLARDPGNPPAMLVETTAPVIVSLIDTMQEQIIDEIVRSYHELFEGDMNVPSDISKYQREHWRFECPKEHCHEFQNRVPVIINAANGEIEPVFCPIHGVAMTPISTLEDYRANPLA